MGEMKVNLCGIEIDNPDYSGARFSIGGKPLYGLETQEGQERMTEEELEAYEQAIKNKYLKGIAGVLQLFLTFYSPRNGHRIIKLLNKNF